MVDDTVVGGLVGGNVFGGLAGGNVVGGTVVGGQNEKEFGFKRVITDHRNLSKE